MNNDLPIRLREPKSSDLEFIYNSWITCLGNAPPFNQVDKNWFSTAQHGIISRLLKSSAVLIACNPEDDDQVFGYVVAGPGRVLHWIYVKHLFRRAHVAHRMLLNLFTDFQEPIGITIKTPSIKYHEERWNLQYRSHRLCRLLQRPTQD